MNAQITSRQIFEAILNSGQITRAQQKALLKMLCWENPITPEDQKQIKQVFHRLDMGLLKVTD